jgi:hypothetical protein
VNLGFKVAQYYRGGKPRIMLPLGIQTDLSDAATWTSGFVAAVDSGFAAFITAMLGTAVSSITLGEHVAISYYHGVDKNQPPAGRWRGPGYKYPPLIRGTPAQYAITGYLAKTKLGSVRRRLNAL